MFKEIILTPSLEVISNKCDGKQSLAIRQILRNKWLSTESNMISVSM
jgi:hypothetical protein